MGYAVDTYTDLLKCSGHQHCKHCSDTEEQELVVRKHENMKLFITFFKKTKPHHLVINFFAINTQTLKLCKCTKNCTRFFKHVYLYLPKVGNKSGEI